MNSIFPKLKVFLLLFIFLCPGLNATHHYHFSYKIQGKSRGKFLLFFPYRVYFEMGASAVFKGQDTGNGAIRFELEKIDSPGYLMRTLSLSGRKLGVFAVDPDPSRAKNFARQKMSEFDSKAPAYSPHVKKRFLFPFRIVSPGSKELTFSLLPGGIIADPVVSLKKEIIGDHEGYRYYFFAHRMMLEILTLYNHSFLPEDGQGKYLDKMLQNREIFKAQLDLFSWKGKPLQLSKNLTRIGGLMAAIIQKHVTVKQRGTFELLYRIKDLNDQVIVLQGSASPNVTVYGGFEITNFRRDVKIRQQDGVILEDSLFVEIRNHKGRGGYGEAKLVRLNRLD